MEQATAASGPDTGDAEIRRTAAPPVGDGAGGHKPRRPRRLGSLAASHRAESLIKGKEGLTAAHRALLLLTGRLIVHAENLSNNLYHSTELTNEQEPRLALQRLMELGKEIRINLNLVYGDGESGDGDLLGQLTGGRK